MRNSGTTSPVSAPPAQHAPARKAFGTFFAFLPAYLLPPLLSLAAIYAFTRLLTPEEYGAYALTLSVTQLGFSFLFSWLQIGVKRFHPQQRETGGDPALAWGIYAGYAVSALAALALCLVLALGISPGSFPRTVIFLGFALLLLRGFGGIGKSFRISELNAQTYAWMECGESVLGLLAGLFLTSVHAREAGDVIAGLAIGALLPIAIDLPALRRRLAGGSFAAGMTGRLFRFGAPFTIGYSFQYVMASSDRLLVRYFLDEAAVGLYAVAYAMAERAISIGFQAVALIAYPLLMNTMEREGPEAARRQAGANLELLLAIGLPSLAGFVVASPHIAAVLLGQAFAGPTVALMPWVASAVFLSCFRLHYFDHAFHLAQKGGIYLWTVGPPALLSILLNILLLPRMGITGAVVSTVVTYAFALILCIGISRRHFRLPFPGGAALRAGGATLGMAAVLQILSFPANGIGLVLLIATGAASYGLLALALDLAGIRRAIRARLIRG